MSFFMALGSFGPPTSPCSGGYHLERGGMLLHDAVGINCKKGATAENQGADVMYMGYVVYVDDRVCVIWFDMTTPPWWREKVKVYYLFYFIKIIE